MQNPTEPDRPSRRRILVVAAAATVVIAASGAAAYVLTGDVPRGTRVLGVELGAKSRSEAARLLRDAVSARTADPVPVRLDGRALSIEPGRIGLTLNVKATVRRATHGPVRLWGHHDVTPVVELDEAKLEAVLRERLDPSRITMTKPKITFKGTKPVPSYGRSGLDLDPGFAAAEVARVWLTGATAEIPLRERSPATTREQVDELVRTVAEQAVAAPVTLTVTGTNGRGPAGEGSDGRQPTGQGADSRRPAGEGADGRQPTGQGGDGGGGAMVELPPAAIARGLVFRADDAGRLTPAIDAEALRKAAAKQFAEVETAPVPASFEVAGGRPRIRPGKAGRVADLSALDVPAVLSGKATVGLVTSAGDTTAASLGRLGIKEKVSSFTTYFTGGRSSPRSQNIITVAKAVDGAVVRPGETFSLNGHTGARDYAAGYQDAPVIVGGKLEPGVGGGASQFTTTLFNAAYYAGLEDVEHKPHSFYFDRYPSVIESTIFYPTLDLKFRNTTPYGILIETATTSRSVTVTMWSTKYYDSVKTEKSPRRNHTSPPTVHREAGPKCITSSGLPGFTQDAWRIIRKDGREVERKKFTWRYDPEPRFVCGGENPPGRKQ